MQTQFRKYITMQVASIALVAVLVLVCAYFVWPTPYQIITVKWGGIERIVAVNRVTYKTITIYPGE